MIKKKPRVGSEFEEAVFRFAKSLDPSSQVLLDHSVPDHDTGEPRQCDVWINAKIGGHWPVSILISCKDHSRKLHSGDVGTFRDEVRSTGASFGVIYSRAGFTGPALRKAQANGYPCCRIYQHEPADIPGSIFFEQYACSSKLKIELLEMVPDQTLITWGEIFSIECKEGTILDIICKVITDSENTAVPKFRTSPSFPDNWAMDILLTDDKSNDSIKIRIYGDWKKYKARMGATLLNGSYCLTDKSFLGTQFGPSIDLRGNHPGEAWIEIEDDDFSLPINRMIVVLYHENIRNALIEELGPKTAHKN